MITVDFSRLAIVPGDCILDLGCGSGRHTAAVHEQHKVHAIGADLNFTDLLAARDRLQFHDQLGAHAGGMWSLTTADATALPFPDACFDLVICSEMLEHVPDDHAAVTEMIRVLKPGKHVVASVPRYLPERICWLLSDDYKNANQGHVRIYRKSELIRRFRDSGLFFLGHHYAHSIHTPYWWLKCLVGPTRSDSPAVNRYHQVLTWDILQKPKITRFIDRLLNPVLGKSLVLYFKKPEQPTLS
ncbi:class I SAM-dependent methyltransferase [Desulfosarcina sp. OttesenSCG-928-A07]|nr:class I SAM-dependent methyltransferase [Desulfosarcina sp. OttesenSCG-928-G17]MDL2329126.1 class I SAM-dependent methyltransferase [Desulfosarcina sp. OttesenSCG-928-A07]